MTKIDDFSDPASSESQPSWQELQDQYSMAVERAEQFPCDATWAAAEAARQALSNSPEVLYARDQMNRRALTGNAQWGRINSAAASRYY